MQEVKYCTKCGKELPKDAVFCPNCGTNVQAGVAPPSETYWSSRQYRRVQRRQRRGDWWGAVTAFGFLIIIAATIVRFPDVFSRL
ncbi:MAG: zinc ribbon domain-containing protein, partial [Thaumarchaeota archaeon]|nr:zinc ribbon domain-containing protein [Nitrososphaerota archaeon]